ncbi:hypothetical protein [Tessaracoccus massiliensis]|uniref:hypothetical protein n=1 Tax=Tessaracoccus massiliensis TaxID=1522311 RepID=UPI00058F5E69|nr:hypothetical protein [Tessaracoccus massiliensis]
MTDPIATFADLAALIDRHHVTPISVHWVDNPATGDRRWHIQVPSCRDFDRLAEQLPTPRERHWLNGDRHIGGFSGRTERHHATADGELIHLCRGCTPEQKETLL